MSPHLSPFQVEAILDRLLQDYPETVSRWAVGVIAEPPEMVRAWLEGLGFDLTEEEEGD